MTYIMDGGTYNDPFNNLNLPTPNPDALQEFKVETSALSARYGHHAASAVNIVTKSGTNTFHGNAFEFLRDYHLNAKQRLHDDATTASSATSSAARSAARSRRTSCSSSAPTRGRSSRRSPADTIVFAPTQAMLNGDFTAFASAACNAGRQDPSRRRS